MQGKELAEGSKLPVEWLPMILAPRSISSVERMWVHCAAEQPLGEVHSQSLCKGMDLPVEKGSEHQLLLLSTHPVSPVLV